MQKPRDTQRATASGPTAPRGDKGKKGDAAFDIWLQRGLHQIYDTVASEPVPEELLRLIEADRKK